MKWFKVVVSFCNKSDDNLELREIKGMLLAI